MNRIREVRKALGLSQQELANELDVDQTAVSQWERGVTMPRYEPLLKLSKLCGASPDYLLGFSSTKKAPNLDELDAISGMQELENVMGRLSEAGRQAVIEQAQTLLRLEKNLKEER